MGEEVGASPIVPKLLKVFDIAKKFSGQKWTELDIFTQNTCVSIFMFLRKV